MIRLSESDLEDLARYPASLQQAALALWRANHSERAMSEAHEPAQSFGAKAARQTYGPSQTLVDIRRTPGPRDDTIEGYAFSVRPEFPTHNLNSRENAHGKFG